MTAPPPPPVPGLTGLAVLARGGYATVYRAVQESVGREVALKMENRTLESERDRRRFLREARAAGRMSGHPNVVDLFDAGVSPDGHPYLIMELCAGSYSEISKTRPLTAPQAREVGVKIADALADAHALGVLHRDVKPANILVTRFGEPVLADFGLAILAEARDLSITLDVLTPAYAPPEVFRHAEPGPSADVYSLCATLFALMRGRPPRWNDDRDPSLMTMIDMFAEAVPDLPGVPADFTNVLRRGMANNPEARPTAAELRDALLALGTPAAMSQMPGEATMLAPPVAQAWGGGTEIRSPSHTSLDPWLMTAMGYRSGSPDQAWPGESGDPWSSTDGELRSPSPAVPGNPPAGGDSLTEPVPADRPSAAGGRRRAWWMVAGLIEVLVVLMVAALWSASSRGGSPQGTPNASEPVSGVGGAATLQAGDACSVAARTDARCPETPECYDSVTVTDGFAKARQIACNGRHTWEVFAMASLSHELVVPSYAVVRDNPQVQAVCNAATLESIARFQIVGWKIEILPPTPEAMGKGDRTFRCLAGKGPNSLAGQQIRFRPDR